MPGPAHGCNHSDNMQPQGYWRGPSRRGGYGQSGKKGTGSGSKHHGAHCVITTVWAVFGLSYPTKDRQHGCGYQSSTQRKNQPPRSILGQDTADNETHPGASTKCCRQKGQCAGLVCLWQVGTCQCQSQWIHCPTDSLNCPEYQQHSDIG